MLVVTLPLHKRPIISENAAQGAGDDSSPARLVGLDDTPNLLLVELYCELRALAGRLMREQRHDSLLQRTALVHEAYLKLGREPLEGGDRTEVLALASIAMRNLLVDRARTRNRRRRSPNGERVSFERISLAFENRAVDLLALHEALCSLGEFDPEMARAVELRFFGGLSMEETARCLEIPLRTLERRWEATRHWLRAEIG